MLRAPTVDGFRHTQYTGFSSSFSEWGSERGGGGGSTKDAVGKKQPATVLQHGRYNELSVTYPHTGIYRYLFYSSSVALNCVIRRPTVNVSLAESHKTSALTRKTQRANGLLHFFKGVSHGNGVGAESGIKVSKHRHKRNPYTHTHTHTHIEAHKC